MDAAFMLREGETLVGQTFLSATEIPGKGFAGGYPGSLCTSWVFRNTNARELIKSGHLPKSESKFSGQLEPGLRANTTNINFGDGDVFRAVGSGGGGLGDPFLRTAEAIARDLNENLISVAAAELLYGAVVHGGGDKAYTVDEAATWARRDQLRSAIVPDKKGSLADISAATGIEGVIHADGRMLCSHCQTAICSDREDWKHKLPNLRRDLADWFEQADTVVRRRQQNPVEIIEYFCQNCACCLAVDVAVRGQDRQPPNFHLAH